MKLLYLSSAAALLFTIVAPNAISQDNATAEPKPIRLERLTPQGNLVQFVATTVIARSSGRKRVILRPLLNSSSARPVFDPGSVIHLVGNVEITIFNRALMLHASTRDELTKDMVLTADQADYNVDTGEIQPMGHVSIKFQNVESRSKKPLPAFSYCSCKECGTVSCVLHTLSALQICRV